MWLLDASIRDRIEHAQLAGNVPSAQQEADFAASYSADVLSTTSKTATIKVQGMITKTPSLMAMLMGGGNVTYPDITNALAAADSADEIDGVIMEIDSPGGTIDGLFDTLAAMESFGKPITARVSGMAASAAYALASKADQIEATNPAARFGSVGIVASFSVPSDTVTITSTNAPKKRPDVTTDEGVEAVREELDALHEIFVDAIATGRGTSAETVNAEFGQGSVLLAGEALKRGMIDAVTTTTARSGGSNPEKRAMDLVTLKASHPDVYAAAVQEGINQERDRVGAHLTLGESCGAMETAIQAVRDGSEMTATLNATYVAAGINRRDQQNRAADDAEASIDAGSVDSADRDATASADLLAAVSANLGVEV